MSKIYRHRAMAVAVAGFVALGTQVANAANAGFQLEEVVVTAQKREQSLDDVGIAVSAFTGDALKEMGVSKSTGIAAQTPGLDFKDTGGWNLPIVTLRGVGFVDYKSNQTSAVAMHVDEVYLTSPAMMNFQLYDIDRVEVLKGPQGTLFGRNTPAGSINYFTRRPTEETEGFVSLSYDEHGERRVEGGVGGALSDSLTARASGFYVKGNGWQDNKSGTDTAAPDVYGARLQFDWHPSEDFNALLILETGKDESIPYTPQATGTNPDGSNAVGYIDSTDIHSFEGLSLVEPHDDKMLNQTLQLEWDLGDMILTSISSYRTFNFTYGLEADASELVLLDQIYDEDFRAWSEEIRLTSDTDGDISWIAGLYLGADQIEMYRDADLTGYIDFLNGDTPIPHRANEYVYEMDAVQDTQVQAVFGHMEWDLSQQWKLTLGGRYTQEEKEYHYVDWLSNYGTLEDLVDYRESKTFGSFSGKIGLDYHTDSGNLIYSSISRGFKSGGYPAGTTARLPEQVASYDPEYLTAYEIGFKMSSAERTLRWEGSAFFYDYQDKQIAFAIPEQDYLQILTNLSETEIYGIETQVQWLPAESWFVQAGMSALHTEIVDPAPFDDAITGNQLPNSPEFTFNVLVNKDWQLSSGGKMNLSLDYAFQTKNYFRVQNDTVQEDYGVANGRLSWTSADANTVVSLWATNLTDEDYLIQSIPVFAYTADIYGKKRTFGLSLDYNW